VPLRCHLLSTVVRVLTALYRTCSQIILNAVNLIVMLAKQRACFSLKLIFCIYLRDPG